MAKNSKRQIEAIVQRLLQRHGVTSAPIPVERLAELEGVGVYVDPALEDDVSGYLFQDKDQEPIIVFNGRHHRNRQRFSVAHELGHYLLHRPQNYRITRDRSLIFRSEASSAGVIPEEIEANTFAAELLMPREMVSTAILEHAQGSLDEIVTTLAKLFHVSKQAMRIRLSALGYLNPWAPVSGCNEE